jgi:hypothetical protein
MHAWQGFVVCRDNHLMLVQRTIKAEMPASSLDPDSKRLLGMV